MVLNSTLPSSPSLTWLITLTPINKDFIEWQKSPLEFPKHKNTFAFKLVVIKLMPRGPFGKDALNHEIVVSNNFFIE